MIFILLVAGFFLTGKLLDNEAERVVNQLYPHDAEGVIAGTNSIEIIRGNSQAAVVFIHGFLESPHTFAELINDIKLKIPADIYAPLLPFHSKNLQTAATFDNAIILAQVREYLAKLAKQYHTLTVIGFSYGGLLLLDLAANNQLPNNIHLILYAPSLFIQSNKPSQYLEAYLYSWWRNYCNYPGLQCNFPSYQSGDEEARQLIEADKDLQYLVISALLKLYQLDSVNRNKVNDIKRPYDIIVAMDDNRVDASRLKTICEKNKNYCHFYPFADGKHIIHWGKNKRAFEDLLVKLIEANQ